MLHLIISAILQILILRESSSYLKIGNPLKQLWFHQQIPSLYYFGNSLIIYLVEYLFLVGSGLSQSKI